MPEAEENTSHRRQTRFQSLSLNPGMRRDVAYRSRKDLEALVDVEAFAGEEVFPAQIPRYCDDGILLERI